MDSSDSVWIRELILPAASFNHGIAMMANYCCDEAFRDVDRAPVVMKSVFEGERDWLCSVQAFLGF
jgi:hypothetical protein